MRRTVFVRLGSACVVWLAALIAAVFHTVPIAADNTRWGAGYFPNVVLTTHEGVPVRFYDDLIKGKIVAIDLIYTTCKYACPLETARLSQVAKLLGDRMGRDVFFYSITIDPDHDTPAVLKEYAAKYQAGPGWTFLTGSQQDIELISRKLGLYSEPNPSNPDGHTAMVLIGNEETGQWMRNSAIDNPKFLARTIGDWLTSWRTAGKSAAGDPWRSYANVPTFVFDRGEYTFRNHCAACHTIGGGDHFGPDLAGVSSTRDRQWLARFIVAPDQVVAAGDPIAKTLLEKYKGVLMPNLGLGTADAAVLIDYIAARSGAIRDAAPSAGPATSGAAAGGANDLSAIVEPYLRIHHALSVDELTGVADAARTVALAAAKRGSNGADIRAAAVDVQQATDLAAARAAFARLGSAILIEFRCSSSPLGVVQVGYCPMVHGYWLQKAETVQNPFYGARMPDCGRLTRDVPNLTK